eukprot:8511672-Karenia_brevis.AAC.1
MEEEDEHMQTGWHSIKLVQAASITNFEYEEEDEHDEEETSEQSSYCEYEEEEGEEENEPGYDICTSIDIINYLNEHGHEASVTNIQRGTGAPYHLIWQ